MVALVSCGCAAGSARSDRNAVPPEHRSLASRTPGPSVVGVVSDSISRKPVPFCNVAVLRTRIGTQTDPSGLFRIAMPDTGTWQLMVMQLGYEKQIRDVRVGAGRATTVLIRMKRRRLLPGTMYDTTARY